MITPLVNTQVHRYTLFGKGETNENIKNIKTVNMHLVPSADSVDHRAVGLLPNPMYSGNALRPNPMYAPNGAQPKADGGTV